MKRIFSYITLALVALHVFAQSFPGEYTSTVWDSSSGLTGNTINDLIQASTGYIYIATYDGLVRTDGVNFVVLNRNTVPELGFVSARSLFEDSQQRIWVGSNDEGITIFDKRGRAYKHITAADGIPNNSVRRITEDRSGNIWIGTAGGVCYITPDFEIKRPAGLEQFGVEKAICIDLYCDTAGRMWLVTPNKGGIYLYSKNSFAKFTQLDSFGAFTYTTVTQDDTGAFWIGMQENGAARVDNGHVDFFNKGTLLEGVSVNQVYVDNERSLWFATESGVFVYRGDFFYKYDKSLGLVDNYVINVLQDREGSIWLGTNNGGLEKMSLGKFRTETLDTAVNAMAEDGAGKVWIGTDDGLFCWNKNAYEENALTKMTAGIRIRHVGVARNGDILLNCYSKYGQIRYTPSTGECSVWTEKNGLVGDKTRVCLEASNGDLYVGTTTGLSVIEPDGNIVNLSTKEGLTLDYIMCLEEDSKGNIWVGTDRGGVNVLRDKQVVATYKSEDGLAGDVVFKINEREDGKMWIATGQGVSRFDGEKFDNLTSQSGIGTDSLFQMIVDYTGLAWFTANGGIYSVRFSEIEDYLDGKIARVEAKRYNKGDGLRSSGITSTSLSMTDSLGRIWFTLMTGYAVYDPVKSKSSNIPPIVNIETLSVDGGLVDFADKIEIGPGVRRIDLNYTALSFTSPEMIRFRTMLEGFDSDYSAPMAARLTSYTNLKPGKYTFRVLAANSDGIWTESPAELSFVLKPYFYERKSFWVAVVLAVVAFAALMVYLRFRSMIAYQRELEQKVEERTTDLKNERDKSERLLLNILPVPVAQKLKTNDGSTIAESYENVTVLFSDIVGFTTISSNHSALEIVTALNKLFSLFDARAKREGIEKIKTIGDAYMAVCGLPYENNDHAVVMARFALGMFEDLRNYNETSPIKFNMRVGLNSGAVIAGVIGETKFIYDVWGDTVNVASRMESTAENGVIHVSESVRLACGDKVRFANERVCQVKGKGEMRTWDVVR